MALCYYEEEKEGERERNKRAQSPRIQPWAARCGFGEARNEERRKQRRESGKKAMLIKKTERARRVASDAPAGCRRIVVAVSVVARRRRRCGGAAACVANIGQHSRPATHAPPPLKAQGSTSLAPPLHAVSLQACRRDRRSTSAGASPAETPSAKASSRDHRDPLCYMQYKLCGAQSSRVNSGSRTRCMDWSHP